MIHDIFSLQEIKCLIVAAEENCVKREFIPTQARS